MNKHCWSPPDVKRVPKATIHKQILGAGLLLGGLILYVNYLFTGINKCEILYIRPCKKRTSSVQADPFSVINIPLRSWWFFTDFHSDGILSSLFDDSPPI